MIHSDDVAMKYESVIRKCYGCERYQHKANADIFRELQQLYIDAALQTEKNELSYKEKWNKYREQVNLVLSSLKNALLKVEEYSLLPELDNPKDEIIGIDAISYTLGIIVTKLTDYTNDNIENAETL